MMKKLLVGIGLLTLTALSVSAQTVNQVNRPLEEPSPENPKYQERQEQQKKRTDRVGVSKDPKPQHGASQPATPPKPVATDSTATPADDKKKPKQ